MVKTRKSLPWSGWKQLEPNYGERKKMFSRCGKKCFLGSKQSYPICSKNTCKINKKGIWAAYVRARQYRKKSKKNNNISKKAKKMLQI